MVKEHLYVFDVQDIREIAYVCPQCGHKMVCSVKGEQKPGERCASCNKQLMMPDEEGINLNVTFLSNLRRVLMSNSVKIRLVVPDPDYSKPSE